MKQRVRQSGHGTRGLRRDHAAAVDHDPGRGPVPAQQVQPLGCVQPPESVVSCRRYAGQEPVGHHRRREIRRCRVQRKDTVPQPHHVSGQHRVPDAPFRESRLQKGRRPGHGAGVFEVNGEFHGSSTASGAPSGEPRSSVCGQSCRRISPSLEPPDGVSRRIAVARAAWRPKPGKLRKPGAQPRVTH